MNYIKIEKDSIANGAGIRTVLWCSGCSLKCLNCHNPQTWDPKAGQEFNTTAVKEIYEELSKPYIKGLTLSGGHPLEPYNIEVCTALCRSTKHYFPDKDIWLYTGYLWEDIKDLPIMKYIDVLVDGPFIQEQRDISLPFCGSRNQRVINVQESLKNKNLILYK